jgi:hypothetical protein
VWYFRGKINDNFILKKIQVMKIRVLCTFVVFSILSISSLASTIDTNPHPTPLLMKFSMKIHMKLYVTLFKGFAKYKLI